MVAHEVGHHVQNLLGIEPKVRQMQQGASRGSEPSVGENGAAGGLLRRRGGKYAEKQQMLEEGDLQAALNAAQAIGDDRLQQQSEAASCRTALPTALRSSATPV